MAKPLSDTCCTIGDTDFLWYTTTGNYRACLFSTLPHYSNAMVTPPTKKARKEGHDSSSSSPAIPQVSFFRCPHQPRMSFALDFCRCNVILLLASLRLQDRIKKEKHAVLEGIPVYGASCFITATSSHMDHSYLPADEEEVCPTFFVPNHFLSKPFPRSS